MTVQKPIAVLLVFPSDSEGAASRPDPSFFQDLFVNDPESLHHFWHDASDGAIGLQGTQVYGWRSHGMTRAAFQVLSRVDKIRKAVDVFANADQPADRVNLRGFDGVAVVGHPADELGSSGTLPFEAQGSTYTLGTSIWDLGTDHRTMAHELGHCFGFDHSFNDSPTAIDPTNDKRPGAYGDMWDIMSANNVLSYMHPRFGLTGPGLNATMRDIAGWLRSDRILDGRGLPDGKAVVFAVTDLRESRPHVLRLDEFDFEFRTNTGWNRAMRPGVQVRVRTYNEADHSKILHTNTYFGRPVYTMGVGDYFELGSPPNPLIIGYERYLKVSVEALDLQAGSATLSVLYRPASRPPVVGPSDVFGGVSSDGGGVIIINGHIYRVPPRSPLAEIVKSAAIIASLDLVEDKVLRSRMINVTLKNLKSQVKQLGNELQF